MTPTPQTDGAQFIIELRHLYRDAMRAIEQQIGMSQTRLEIMHELFHADEMSQAELQQRLGVEGAVITRIVKQLESAGLVTRRADPRDNRFTLVALSETARREQANADTAQFKDTFGTQIMAGLTPDERTRLLRALSRIQKNVWAARDSQTPPDHADRQPSLDEPVVTQQNEGWQFHIALIHLYREIMRVIEQRAGMSQTRIDILHDLFHADEMSQAELQQRLDVEGAVITRIVKQLESAGLVTRRADPRDNRFTLVALSETARREQASAESSDFKATFGAQLMDRLDADERALLLRAMARVQENLRTIRTQDFGLRRDPAN